jgi:hypothetical protein
MASTTRSEKLKSVISIILISAIIYSVIALLSSLYLLAWSWGEKLNLLQQGIVIFLTRPIKPEITLWAIPLNGIFWGIIVACIKLIFRKT